VTDEVSSYIIFINYQHRHCGRSSVWRRGFSVTISVRSYLSGYPDLADQASSPLGELDPTVSKAFARPTPAAF
jgi:hypothetical protein